MSSAAGLYLPVSPSLGVSEPAVRVARVLGNLPLASASDISGVLRLSVSRVHASLWELREAGLADFSVVGWSRQSVARWWLAGSGLQFALGSFSLGSSVSWHHEGGRCRLLDVLPSLEWFYRCLGDLVGEMGSLLEFTWISGSSFDAAALFDVGWVAFSWSGILQNEDFVQGRMDQFANHFYEMAYDMERPWPSLFCFVVTDAWQREVVLRAAAQHSLLDRLVVWSVRDNSRSGLIEPRGSRGWVRQYARRRESGAWGWDRRVMDWVGQVSPSESGILDMAWEWPGLEMRLVRAHFMESSVNRHSYRLMSRMRDSGLIHSVEEGSKLRYGVTRRGTNMLRRRDRLSWRHDVSRRDDPEKWDTNGRIKAHEAGVRGMAGDFLYNGLPVASGWRSWEHLGGAGGLAPDAMVWVEHSPYGPGWHYVEYERSARGLARIRRKLSGYHSSRRQDRWPVLVVSWNGVAESYFWDAARERGGLPMLTTTIERIKASGGSVCNSSVWSMYGSPVYLG